MSNIPTELAASLAKCDIALPDDVAARLGEYAAVLWEWNERINLTRHTDYEAFVARDLVDSLVFAKFLDRKQRVVDVGSGGGVPGVMLAIVRPDLRITLTESVAKKARVLDDIAARLELPVRVHHGRAEELVRRHRADTLVVRAVARLRKLLEWFEGAWTGFDRMLVLKGPAWVDERGEARHHGLMRDKQLRRLDEYPLHGTESMSVLLEIRPKQRGTDNPDDE